MGGTTFSRDDYAARSNVRAAAGAATFAHDHDIRTGKTAASVHPSLRPYGVTRESRDSAAHPVAVPIGILLDTTGSMGQVPGIIQKALPKLMGAFLDDKASGKRYLGDGYPAILISAVDDYRAMGGPEGTLQVGQFESGIEIDDNLTALWITGQGGGSNQESYELGMYFYARHTIHDHFEKRGRKGYLVIIGDETCYPQVGAAQVESLIGDHLEGDLKLQQIVNEVRERYHVFFVLPNMTSNYNRDENLRHWQELIGPENVIRLEDPSKICETIVSIVAMIEEGVEIDDLKTDLGFASQSLVPLSKIVQENRVARYSAASLPAVAGTSGGSERL